MMKRKLLIGIVFSLVCFGAGVVLVSVARMPKAVMGSVAPTVRADFVEPTLTPAPAPAAPVPSPDESVSEWEPPQSPKHTASVLETGEFHGDEVSARTGERWLGLYMTKQGTFLRESVLTVTTVKDDIVDSDNEMTGKRVSVNHQPAPILLVKDARGLQSGPVSTVFAGTMSLPTPDNVSLSLGGAGYSLIVMTKDKSRDPYINFNDATLVLSKDGETEQVLYDLGGTGEPTEAYWRLLWAGDMDGDNKLDLYVEVSHHYNVSQRKLFLSSQAEEDKLVREVAELITTGC